MHTLILGQSGSGKSYLCKALVKEYKKAGIPVLVLDPLLSVDWGEGKKLGADYLTDNVDQFVIIAKKNRNCALIIDEGPETIGMNPKPHVKWLATQSRHRGHLAHFISQRNTAINMTVRNQCSTLFAFNVSRKDAESLAHDWNDDLLLRCHELQIGHYIEKKRMEPAKLCKPIK